MDKMLGMMAFVHIVEGGSLTAAAKALNKSLPSIVRILATLEKSLGVRLLNRTTRRITLTDEGRYYVQRCRQILADIEETELELSAQQSEPRGHLLVTAPEMFGTMHVAPAVTSFLQYYDQIHVDLLLLDRVVNLVEEGVDVAIRIGHLADSSMIAKTVGQVRRVVCASPDYLHQVGIPERPEKLAQYECVRFAGLTPSPTWQFFEKGKAFAVHTQGSFSCNQVSAAMDACVAGLGFGMFYCYQVEPLIKQGKLKIVLGNFEPEPVPISVVYSHAKLVSVRIRFFVDWMTKKLR